MPEVALPFKNREEAGRRLAAALGHLRGEDAVVLGLPRGGVPVAAEVARALGAPLDVILVRKLGAPFQPELAMGAIGEDGVRVLDPAFVRRLGVTDDEVAQVEAREQAELSRRAERYRMGHPRVPVAGRVAVIVDDGVATGATALAAIQVARAHGAGRVVLAIPVAPSSTAASMVGQADEVVCLEQPDDFLAIGEFYEDFSPTTDEEVVSLLGTDRSTAPADEEVVVAAGDVGLPGHLVAPAGSQGIVLFAHGSGSSRHSPRNRAVAEVLNQAGLATLLFDLLTAGEEQDRRNVFDVGLLGTRLAQAHRWLATVPVVDALPVGYFGASTGAAAALWAAADPATSVAAVVSRGGRPDLAGSRLELVRSPTLLIVGALDTEVLRLNRAAQAQLTCESRIEVVAGATHLFEEPGTLDAAADLAARWFVRHLTDRPDRH